eukprot:10853437-Ditylum_brightwellii.AAC.1
MDDPSYNEGYGRCAKYAPGADNHRFCEADDADEACYLSCGTCSSIGLVQPVSGTPPAAGSPPADTWQRSV